MSNNPRHYFGDSKHIQRNTFSELSTLTDNVSAIRLLKTLEAEGGRDATDAEKDVLSRYTGWGGLSKLFTLELPEARYINAEPIGSNASGPVRTAYVRTMIALHPKLADRPDGYFIDGATNAHAERLLTDEEWASARASVNNAHFTSPDVIQAMWDSVLPVLPDGPLEILEPSAGIGNFLAFAPPSVIARATVTAVELDQISGRILRQIYPDAKVLVQGFETAPLRTGAYDLIISNVPFGNYSVPDLRYGGGKLSIHDYFFERGMDLVKPGGLMAAITSRYTLDRKHKKTREAIAMKGDLIAAVRMPENSQAGQAGAVVTEDVLFLRGRNTPRTRIEAGNAIWVNTYPVELEISNHLALQLEKRGFTAPNLFDINRYFEHFPEAVLGDMAIGSGIGGSVQLAVRSDLGRDLLPGHIREALQILPERFKAAQERDSALTVATETPGITVNAAEVNAHRDIREMVGTVFQRKDGSFAIVEDVGLGISGEDSRELVIGDMNLSRVKQGQFALYLPVRDAWREVLAKMQDTRPAEDGTEHPALLAAQEALRSAYDAFAARYGALTQHVKALGDDVHVSAVSSIERYDARTRTAEKTGIFYARTITPTVEPERVDTPSDAMLLSMNRFGRLDVPYMARKLDQDEAAVRSQITGGDRPLAYIDADSGELLPAYQYLSGNVRRKLAALRTRAESEGTADLWSGNIAALESVLPDNVPISDIEVLLGADWVPISDYEDFAHEVLGAKSAMFSFVPRNNAWNVYLARIESDKQDEYGTARRPLESLLPGLLNRSDIRVFDRTADGKQVLNGEETMLANEKAKAITAAWKEWLPQGADRVARLERIYNDRFTGFVPIHVPGDGLKIEGMSDAISLRGHQNSGVMRSVLQDTCIFNHEVGTGKTYTQIAAGMKLLELGLVDRAVFVVPKKTIGQFGTSAISLFPHRRIAVMDDTQTSDKDRRRRFLAALANDRYDAVILTYNGYQSLALPLEHELAFYQGEEDTVSDLIDEALASDDKLSVKRMEKMRKTLSNKIALIRQKRSEDTDKIIGQFDNVLGKRIALFVDEFHNFKNDNVSVPGNSLGIAGSARAMDMRMKSRYILGNGGRFYGASGTLVANSLLEFYVLQRYFQEDTLRQMGITNALAWYQTFLVQEAEPEPDPAGQGWRVKERPFLINASEAVMPLTAVMDTVRADDVGIPRPQATYETRVIPNSAFFNLMLSEAGERLKDIRDKKVDPSVDNMLLVLHHLNQAGLDPRMRDSSMSPSDDEPCKINEVTRDVMQSLAARDGYGLQLIFCDMGIPKGARKRKISNDAGEEQEMSADEAAGISGPFCFYDALIDKLVASGVPRDRIATIYDAKNDSDLEKLLIRANGGDFSVMIGSTMSMGVGLNLQTHVTDIRFLTVPYRPDQVEQAIGRGLRQGNQNERIKITFYTQGQPEAYRYKLLDYKSKALRAVLQADRAVRRLDLSTNLNYNETMALTMGDPRLADIFKLEDRMQKLRTLRKSYAGRRSTYSSDLHYASNSLEKQIAQLERMRGEHAVIAQIPDKAKWSARILGDEPVGPISVTSKLEPLRAMMRSPVILHYGDYPVIASAHDFGIRYLLRRTEEEAPFYVGENPSQIEAVLRHWDETMAEVELRVMGTKKRIEELRALLAKPFEHDVEMEELSLEIEALRISTGLQDDADEAAIARAEAHLASIAQARGANESIAAEQVEQAAEGIETNPERLREMLERKTLLDTAEREHRQATAPHQVMAHSPESTERTRRPRR
ncbi:DEAD/DEAH box helicase family protein, partial [Acidithiobacillus sp. MC6.1]|nr:DEAD/DEAH box helicase family protein [Acidithiobacillus sp. MC6.1]